MKRRSSGTALERELYRSFLLLSALIIVLSLGITLYVDITQQRKDMDAVISGTAAYIAHMPKVAGMLEKGYPDPEAKADVDSLCRDIPDINVVIICDKNGLRFYHTDRHRTGETYVAGDETAILAGSEPYITTGYGTRGSQRRAFHAVTNGDGQIIGFVMASVFTARISARHRNIFLIHAVILVFMMAVSIFMTHAILARLRSSLMGYDPDELLNLYLRQDEVMNSIDEGMIAADRDGRILYYNEAARQLFSAAQGLDTGRPIRELYPASQYDAVLANGRAIPRLTWFTGNRTLFIDEVPIRGKNQTVQGTLLIILDKTETLRASDELSGARTMIDTLRAVNHEFLNKLHIILGYLQTGEIQKAMDFITNSRLVSSQSIREAANCIRSSRICALVIGKMMHAGELGIRLTVSPDSSCIERELFLPLDAYITIIGNLLENAIEELHAAGLSGADRPGEIHLGLYCQPEVNLILCEDNGGGIEPALLEHIFEKGVSSKGEDRGMGLFLIHQLAETYHGEITIDTEKGEGTCITITFTAAAAGQKEDNNTAPKEGHFVCIR